MTRLELAYAIIALLAVAAAAGAWFWRRAAKREKELRSGLSKHKRDR